MAGWIKDPLGRAEYRYQDDGGALTHHIVNGGAQAQEDEALPLEVLTQPGGFSAPPAQRTPADYVRPPAAVRRSVVRDEVDPSLAPSVGAGVLGIISGGALLLISFFVLDVMDLVKKMLTAFSMFGADSSLTDGSSGVPNPDLGMGSSVAAMSSGTSGTNTWATIWALLAISFVIGGVAILLGRKWGHIVIVAAGFLSIPAYAWNMFTGHGSNLLTAYVPFAWFGLLIALSLTADPDLRERLTRR